MAEIKIEIKGINELIQSMNGFESAFNRVSNEQIRQAALAIQVEQQRRVPVAFSNLQKSIKVRRDSKLNFSVGPRSKYAVFVEKGTRPHWPPRDALKLWARKKGINVFLVQRAIARHGTKPKPFVQPGLQAALARVYSILEQIPEMVVREMLRK